MTKFIQNKGKKKNGYLTYVKIGFIFIIHHVVTFNFPLIWYSSNNFKTFTALQMNMKYIMCNIVRNIEFFASILLVG